MENTVQTAQFDMVRQLVKPGQAIFETLDADKAHLLHMILGMTGEAVELLNYDSLENLIEELGDFRFYQYGLYDYFGLTTESVLAFYRASNGFAGVNVDLFIQENQRLSLPDSNGAFTSLVTAVGNLQDLAKKYLVYNKPEKFLDIEADRPAVNVQVLLLLGAIEITYGAIIYEFDVTDNEVLRGNQDKLLTGENARYKSGAYSDQQANDRADKVNENQAQASV